MTKAELVLKLKPYLPNGSETYVVDLLVKYRVNLRLNKQRTSKYGDYRHPYGHKGHRITINKDLNPFAFLITFIHEVAHLTAWEKYGNKVAPHGIEWKNEYRELLKPLLESSGVLPEDIHKAVARYIHNPSASSCSDENLFKVLTRYDKVPALLLENLPKGARFKTEDGREFIKSEKLRTWFICYLIPTQREFRVKGTSKVELVIV